MPCLVCATFPQRIFYYRSFFIDAIFTWPFHRSFRFLCSDSPPFLGFPSLSFFFFFFVCVFKIIKYFNLPVKHRVFATIRALYATSSVLSTTLMISFSPSLTLNFVCLFCCGACACAFRSPQSLVVPYVVCDLNLPRFFFFLRLSSYPLSFNPQFIRESVNHSQIMSSCPMIFLLGKILLLFINQLKWALIMTWIWTGATPLYLSVEREFLLDPEKNGWWRMDISKKRFDGKSVYCDRLEIWFERL